MIQESLFMAAGNGPRTQTEIFVESWPKSSGNDNYIYQTQSSSAIVLSSDLAKEWTQVFDLNDTALIVYVKNDLMMLKLMHLTEQPLNLYQKYIQTKYLSMPSEAAGAKGFSFIKTIEQERDILKDLFDKYSTAKLKVDGQIIPNIVLNSTLELQPNYKRFGFEIDQQRRTLSFLTTSNLLYQIDFDRFFLKKDESVFIQTIELTEISGFVRAFDIVLDHSYNQYVYVVGTSRSVNAKTLDNQRSIQEIQDQTLTFIRYEAGSVEPIYQQARQDESSYFGFVKLIKRGVESILNRANNQIIGGSSKRVQPDIRQSFGNMGFEEGVVALKSLSNGLIAAIYTSGILKVWSVVSGVCLLQHDFFDNGEEQDLSLKCLKRIVEAKIQSISFPFITDTQSKSIKLAVSYAHTQIKEYSRIWIVEQFNLNFTDLPIDQIDRTNENTFDLSQQQHSLIPHLKVQFPENNEVQDLVIDNNKKSSHIWLLSQNENKHSTIQDLLEPNEAVYTRELQEKYHQLFDKVNLNYDLQTNPYSPFKQQLQKHYFNRLTVKGRFSNLTIKEQLQKLGFSENDFSKFTYEQLLSRVSQESDVLSLQQILLQMIKIETVNQKAYGISAQFEDLPFRLVLRPLGISLLKIDSYFSTISSRVSDLTAKLQSTLKSQNLTTQQEDSFQPQFGMRQQSLQQSSQQFLELITSFQDKPILLLLASMQLLHLDVLPQLDKLLRSSLKTDAAENIREVIIRGMRESYNYEMLNNEVQRIINGQRESIEVQINQVIASVVEGLLQNHANDGKEIDIQANLVHNKDDNLYSGSLIRVIERGTQQEIQSLYQLLRDLLILKTFINQNKPKISPSDIELQQDQVLQDSLVFWLKQLASLTWILNQHIDLRVLSNKKRLPIIQRILNQNPSSQMKKDLVFSSSQVSQQSLNKQISLSLYFLTYIPQTYQHSPLTQSFNLHFDLSVLDNNQDYINKGLQRSGQVEPRSAMFANILVSFIKKYMFKQNLQEQTFVPAVVRKLYSVQQFRLIDKYLRPMENLNTIALSFLRALLAATYSNSPSQFLDHICSCLATYHHTLNLNLKLQPINLIIQKKRRLQISQKINEISDNEITRFYLVLLSQLEKLDERYQLFVINSALMEENIPSFISQQNQQTKKLSDKDYFYNLMFDTATVSNSPDSLYTSCTQIQNKQKQRMLIGEFLHKILQTTEKQHLLFSQYFFDQDLIDLGLDYLCSKVMEQLTQDKRRALNKSQFDIKTNVTKLIRDIHIISQLYDRQVQTSRYLWFLATQIEGKILDQYNGEQFAEKFQDMLQLKEYVLFILYQNAVYLGEHLFITDESDIEEPSKKRKSDEMSGSKIQKDQAKQSINTSDELIYNEGYGVLNYLDQYYTSLKLNKGNVKQITINHISQELYLTLGRIKVAQFFNERDADQIMRILVELKEYQLAINISLAFNLEVAYPLTYFIQEVRKLNKEEVNEWVDQELHLREKVQVTQSGKSSKGQNMYQVQVSSHKFTLKIKQLISLAQGLLSIQEQLPLTLEQVIIDQGHIKELVEFYLKWYMFDEIFNMLRTYQPKSIEDMVVSDYKLLAYIMSEYNPYIEENKGKVFDLKVQLNAQNTIVDNKFSYDKSHILDTNRIRNSVQDDINDFLGRKRLVDDRAELLMSVDIEQSKRILIEQQICQQERFVENAQVLQIETMRVITQVLNK
eukprot:403350023